MMNAMHDVIRYQLPLEEGLSHELIPFWNGIFGDNPDITVGVLRGEEIAHSSGTLYLIKRGEELAGTCLTTVSKAVPALGGFGEVATAPRYRGQGIASELCVQAVDDFRREGGDGLFLGTGNPAAARVYYRQGWRKLAGANVMANISNGDSPEEFLTDYFRGSEPATVLPASAAVRIPMIPLIVAPHDWQVLDANAGIFSTRYRVQHSCMGLYPKYEAVVKDGRGARFGTFTGNGRLVGLATARLTGANICQVDGFAHKRYIDSWTGLIQAAMDWGAANGGTKYNCVLSVEDEEKRALFESLGFNEAGADAEFDLDGRKVASVRLEA